MHLFIKNLEKKVNYVSTVTLQSYLISHHHIIYTLLAVGYCTSRKNEYLSLFHNLLKRYSDSNFLYT